MKRVSTDLATPEIQPHRYQRQPLLDTARPIKNTRAHCARSRFFFFFLPTNERRPSPVHLARFGYAQPTDRIASESRICRSAPARHPRREPAGDGAAEEANVFFTRARSNENRSGTAIGGECRGKSDRFFFFFFTRECARVRFVFVDMVFKAGA